MTTENVTWYEDVNSSTTNIIYRRPYLDIFDPYGNIRIPLYSLIFLLSVVGNSLVILTLIRNRRMRTVTNVFLLNLSVSDLLLAVFCMPFSLIPQLMRNFIFGDFMCKSIRYSQAVSVVVSCFTLVTISLERYFAIVEPLLSRRWQTRSHSYKCIVAIWISALILVVPIALSQKLLPLQTGHHACREIWPPILRQVEISYSIILACILFIIPMFVMALAYGCIAYRLWIDIRRQMQDHNDDDCGGMSRQLSNSDTEISTVKAPTVRNGGHVSLRLSNLRHSVANRKRVIKMLFVVVLEYFICWSPLYVVSTWKIVDYLSIEGKVSQTSWSMMLLLAYSSSFIHPITYCFMNKNFRKGFLSVFRCCVERRRSPGTCTEMSNLNSTSSPGRNLNREYTYSKVAPEDRS